MFFSTFSTPILSAALTFGLFLAGRFSADLRNFNQVVDSPAAAALAGAFYWILPNLAPFDVRAQVVHAQPVPVGQMALATRLRRPVHRRAARRRDVHLLAPRFQMTAAIDPSPGRWP